VLCGGCGRSQSGAPELGADSEREIINTVVRSMAALRDGDTEALKSLLYSGSTDGYKVRAPESAPNRRDKDLRLAALARHLQKRASGLGLNSVSSEEIRRSARIETVDTGFLRDVMVYRGGATVMKRSDVPFSSLQPVVVSHVPFVRNGRKLLSIVVRERGQWRLHSLPILTTEALKYQDIMDAIADPVADLSAER
jgi:hypothetical protein